MLIDHLINIYIFTVSIGSCEFGNNCNVSHGFGAFKFSRCH